MHIVFYGPEGSGKGTQAQLLSARLLVPVYTSGDLVREMATNDTGPLGAVCKKALTEGIYVPDPEMFELWRVKLQTDEARKGFILDGFPRNIDQAKFLIEQMNNEGYHLDAVVYLTLSDVESMNRLSKRNRKLFAGSTINHDDRERVKHRLETYRKLEKPIVEFFKQKNLLREVHAIGRVEDVFNCVITSLGLAQ